MTSPATPEVEESQDVRLKHRFTRFVKRISTKVSPRPQLQKRRSSLGNTPSRGPTFSSPAAHNTSPRRPKVENKAVKVPCPLSPAESPRPESPEVKTCPKSASLWAQAYREAKKDPGFVTLLESYSDFLADRYGLSKKESTELIESLLNFTSEEQDTPIQKIAERTLNDLESTRLTFRVGDRDIVVRKQVQKVFDFLTPFKGVFGAAAAAEPSASLAWTGVMAALPFLENILKQDESAAEGFEKISFLLIRYALLEKDFLHEKSESSTPISIEHSRVINSIKERIVKVYVIVYEYQIRIILQYAHAKPRRFLGDMLLLNDWKKMTSDINEKDLEIDRAVNTAKYSSLRNGLQQIDESITKTMRTVLDAQKDISSKLDISILDRIPYVENAVFNSEVIDKQGKCLQGTQRNALNTIQRWAESPDSDPIFWLAGMAGTGKSTIAATVANCLHNRKQFFNSDEKLDSRTFLGATFFLSHEDPERNTVKYVFPTIARTMAERFPDIGQYISQSIYRDTTVGTARFAEQMERLLIEPLAAVSKDLLVSVRLIIIIDSIDECEKSSEAEQLLRLLTKLGGFHPLDARVLVVSRPEKHISQILDDPKYRVEKLILEKITPQIDCSDPDDITKFLKHEVDIITIRRSFAHDWIKNEEMSQLIEKADGLFIYAATTCRFLDATDDDGIQGLRLRKLIEGKTDHGTPEARLDEIYRKVLTFPTRNMSKYPYLDQLRLLSNHRR
ncbi:hypothetical protein NW766_011014 [Fusarium irregulare]|uniref:NACHT domain-containing protein n=1 Tax=Fusarium irregulare TaxID=2494466 RepID=A0A9W8PG07_9HYPO|nr:hypothetical protein NW766_011014 [Fusarium irregulare]